MITLKHVDQNFTGVFQLLNKIRKLFLLLFITNAFTQVSDYEEYLNFLPDSVRSSVESRLTTDVEDNSEYDELNNIRRDTFLEMEESFIEYDEFDNEIPSFNKEDLKLYPGEYPNPYGESFPFGSFIKLYNYELTGGLSAPIVFDLNFRINALLVNPVVPVRFHERREGFTGHSLSLIHI